MAHNHRYQEAKRVTIIGGLLNALLGVIKLIGGVLFHSHGLIADGFHSLADLLTDGMVLFASKYGSQIADDRHPYGHQRIETAATFLLAVLLILTGSGIIWDSLTHLIHDTQSKVHIESLAIALISILVNEGLYQYTLFVGQSINSSLIIANAWHHRSDAAASLVVLLGILGNILGFLWLDSMAAIVVGVMIIQMGKNYGWNSAQELIDTAIDPLKIAKIESIINNTHGVQKIHQLRTRSMGQDIFVDVHILVDPFISVSEGHYIAQNVHQFLMQNIKKIKDVTVHVDPEDDETQSPSFHLPNRFHIEQTWIKPWKDKFPEILSCNIHYLDGVMTLDLFLDDSLESTQTLQAFILNDINQRKTHSIHVRFFIAKPGNHE